LDVANPLEPFKFWASKPLGIALAYFGDYASDKNVLFDPFAGSGVFVYTALLKGKKAIYNDLCPYAVFLARNAIKPVNVEMVQKAFNEVMRRPLDREILSTSGKVIIERGKTVEEVVEWLYSSACDEADVKKRLCARPARALYFIWNTEYYLPKTQADDYANQEIRRNNDKRYRIFFDVICKVFSVNLEGKKRKAYVFDRKCLNEKWKYAFEKNPKAWLEKSTRKKPEPGIVNEIAANLTRLGLAKRMKRFPVEKRIECPVHKGRTQPLSKEDWKKIRAIESLRYPFPEFIPNVALTYEYNGIAKSFLQYREFQTFVPEDLSTIEANDWSNKIPKLKHYFTKRNLIALSITMWSISKVQDCDLRDQLYLIFTSNLHMSAKFDRLGNYGRWATGYYASLDDFKENNVIDQMTKGWGDMKRIKDTIWTSFNSKLGSISYDETWDVDEFLEHVNEPKVKNVLWLKEDARRLDSVIKRRIVDVVFTDPPYRGGEFAVQYYELTAFYVGWLELDQYWKRRYGDLSWWREEIIENIMQNKDLDHYIEMLSAAFVSVNEVVKRDAVWILTYHSVNKDVWEGLKKVLEKISLKIPTFEDVKTHQIRAKGKGSYYVSRYGSVRGDAYIVLTKEQLEGKETLQPIKRLSQEEFLRLVFEKMKGDIVKETGMVTWDLFTKHFPDVVIKYGGPYGETRSYKELFHNITIELAGDLRMLDRDKVGDALYDFVYKGVQPEALLRRALCLYGAQRKEIPRTELDLKVLPKINGRIDNVSRIKMIKELFKYDPIGNKYIFTGPAVKVERMEKYLEKGPEKAVSALPMPPELVLKISENADSYGGHKVKQMTGDVSCVITSSKNVFFINVNDDAGVRRFASGTPEKDKAGKVVVFVYSSEKENKLKAIARQLMPAGLVAVPYDRWKQLVEAFREYDPLKVLKDFLIPWEE